MSSFLGSDKMFLKKTLELIEKNGITKNKLLVSLNLSKNCFRKWENGSIPNVDTAKKIAEYFNVSVDYLLGRTDDADESVTVNKSSCSDDDLKKLFADGYELKYMTIWESDPDTVSITMQKKNLKTADHALDEHGEIAAFGSENPHPTTELPDDEQSLLDSYRTLDTYDKGEISGTIKHMLRSDKYSNQDESYLA